MKQRWQEFKCILLGHKWSDWMLMSMQFSDWWNCPDIVVEQEWRECRQCVREERRTPVPEAK